jgi:hypothetical protein
MVTNRRGIRRPRKVSDDPMRWWRALKTGTDWLGETGHGFALTFRGDPKLEELARRAWFMFGTSFRGIGTGWWAWRTLGRPDAN